MMKVHKDLFSQLGLVRYINFMQDAFKMATRRTLFFNL